MAELSKPAKIGIVAFVIAAIVGVSVAVFRYMNPGLWMPYKCNEGGDSTRKFYDPNWQARGAVCDGYWIPFGTNLNGKNHKDVLAKMAQINTVKPTTTAKMKELAELAAK